MKKLKLNIMENKLNSHKLSLQVNYNIPFQLKHPYVYCTIVFQSLFRLYIYIYILLLLFLFFYFLLINYKDIDIHKAWFEKKCIFLVGT